MTQYSIPPATPLQPSSKSTLGAPSKVDKQIRTLVVDDSVVIRRLITRMLTSDPAIEVVGSARDGVDALAKVESLQPDLVTLDVEMPEMNGLDALRLIQARYPKVRVIMCSSLTERGATMTIDALMAGAGDYVTKQHSSELSEGAYETLRLELLAKIRTMFNRPTNQIAPSQPQSALTFSGSPLGGTALGSNRAAGFLTTPPAVLSQKRLKPQILAIGVSTGGPSALAEIFPLIPSGFSLPIVIVQHMPPFFTRLLAERLSRLSEIPVFEATQGMEAKAGVAIIAPGDFHMRLVKKNGRVEVDLNQQEQENSCRPAVDVLFRSVAEVYGGSAIAVILTGMGQDGLLGVRAMKGLGAAVLVQDSATSVVWGMPGAVAGAKLADAVLPLKDIIPEVLRLL